MCVCLCTRVYYKKHEFVLRSQSFAFVPVRRNCATYFQIQHLVVFFPQTFVYIFYGWYLKMMSKRVIKSWRKREISALQMFIKSNVYVLLPLIFTPLKIHEHVFSTALQILKLPPWVLTTIVSILVCLVLKWIKI